MKGYAVDLGGFFYKTGTNATGTDPNFLDLSLKKSPNFLQVGQIAGFGLHVGMRDFVAGDRFLAADFTGISHGSC